MASQVEVQAPGEFIYSEASGTRSRENVNIVAGAGLLPSGRLIGKITAGGKYDNFRADNLPVGVSTAVGVLYAEVDATGAVDMPAVLLVRDCELVAARVNAEVGGDKAAALTALGTAGVIFR